MLETLLIALAAVGIALAVVVALVLRRLWQLMMSVECLCNNVGGLRQQIGQGEHGHAP